MRKLNVLDSNGFYREDFIVDVSGDVMPENWTVDLVGDGYYKAQYKNGTRDPETGEWTGGLWEETSGPSKEILLDIAIKKRDNLLRQAKQRMGPLQDAVDLDIATDAEIGLLNKWKTFRVLVNRLDLSSVPDIEWPAPPEPIVDIILPVDFAV